MLGNDMELVEGLPVLYIKSLKALVVSDLHLGYEGGMVKSGLAIPKANLKSVIGILLKAAEGRDVERLIIVGDVKNDFSGVISEEINELRDIVRAMKEIGVSIDVAKGNHDNFLDGYSKGLGIRVHGGELQLGEYFFAHGDKRLGRTGPGVETIIMGHEHPSIGIRGKAGNVERLRCFLYGRHSRFGRMVGLIVLPAMGYFETGSDVNTRRTRPMSPILAHAKIEEMNAIVVGHGSTLDFGKVGKLRELEA